MIEILAVGWLVVSGSAILELIEGYGNPRRERCWPVFIAHTLVWCPALAALVIVQALVDHVLGTLGATLVGVVASLVVNVAIAAGWKRWSR